GAHAMTGGAVLGEEFLAVSGVAGEGEDTLVSIDHLLPIGIYRRLREILFGRFFYFRRRVVEQPLAAGKIQVPRGGGLRQLQRPCLARQQRIADRLPEGWTVAGPV